MKNIIAKRLKAARKHAGLTQQQLASQLGFKDRQTLAAVEAGARKVSAEELLAAMSALDRDLEYFTDPFRLDGEGCFSWRTSAEVTEPISEFDSHAGKWVSIYRHLIAKETRTAPIRLDLTERSSYEDAHLAAEWLSREWALGEVPARLLEDAVRARLRVLLLYVDAPEGVSGAALKLPDVSSILINRNEPEGRRTFNLAHELFHLLTWETIPPDYSEDGWLLNSHKRSEQLANCFASALLMPEKVIRKWCEKSPHRNDPRWSSWLNDCALKFRVSSAALQWRLVQLGMLDKEEVDETPGWNNDREGVEGKPRLFGPDFVRVLSEGIEKGRISVRRASALIDLSIDQLSDLFREYSIKVPFDI